MEAIAGVIEYEQFLAVSMKAGVVKECLPHPSPKSTKLLVLKVDLGEGQLRQICAGLREFYAPEQLIGRNIVVVANLAPRKMMGVESNGMLLAATGSDGVPKLVTVEGLIEPGSGVK